MGCLVLRPATTYFGNFEFIATENFCQPCSGAFGYNQSSHRLGSGPWMHICIAFFSDQCIGFNVYLAERIYEGQKRQTGIFPAPLRCMRQPYICPDVVWHVPKCFRHGAAL